MSKIIDTRRAKFLLRYEMYGDNYRDQVEKKLGQIYKTMVELKLNVQINDNNNLYKQVVNAISNVYSFGVTRVFDDTTTQELYEELRVDKIMSQANRYVNAFNDLVLQVSWDAEKQKPKLLLRLPHNTEVVYNNNAVEAVMYFVSMVGENKSTERWAYWSKDEHYYIDKGETETKVAVNTNEAGESDFSNPLGELPFVFMHNGWRDPSFWDKYTGDDLVGGTIDLAVHLTFLNHLVKSQSFKQLVGKGDNISELKGQISDPMSVLTLTGQNTEIDVLDLQSNYDQLNKVTQDLANNIAVSYGISPNQFRMTSQASSGFALQMENLKLDRFTIEQQQDFKFYEQELFGKLKLVLNYYNNTPTKDSKMLIDFTEPNYPNSAEVALTVDTQRIDLGLTSPHKLLMRNNPDLSEKEAKAEIKDNINSRNEMLNKINENTNPETLNSLLNLETS